MLWALLFVFGFSGNENNSRNDVDDEVDDGKTYSTWYYSKCSNNKKTIILFNLFDHLITKLDPTLSPRCVLL